MRRSAPKPPIVLVVGDNQRTLDDLQQYFERVGVASTSLRELDSRVSAAPHATVLLLFPDGYQQRAVQVFLQETRRARPKLLVVLVTSAPQDFSEWLEPCEEGVPSLVLPRPAFGWTILDAIRSA